MDKLTEEILRLRTENPILAKMMLFCDQLGWPPAEMLEQILTGTMEPTPPQRKLFDLVRRRLAK